MADHIIEKKSSEDDDLNKNEKRDDYTADPEFFSCMLQPSPSGSDPNYIGIRRLLLLRKAESGVLRRKVYIYIYIRHIGIHALGSSVSISAFVF